MTKYIYTYTDPTCEPHLNKACLSLQKGEVIAYPTDVNWAIGCSPKNKKAIKKLQQIKNLHPEDKPFSLICSSLSMASEFAYITAAAYKVLRKILPGPYTVILPSHKNLERLIQDSRKTVGIRIPNKILVTDLCAKFQSPILSSSLPCREETLTGEQVVEDYGRFIDLILDLKKPLEYKETTIIDMSCDNMRILRQGLGDTQHLG
jgi:tRNA threonylcarbamoyl adenosine modification protein (Sua5/YciO/YrdC/YwlC family)